MNTRPLWLACTAAAMFAIIVAPDIARYFDLDAAAFHVVRCVRRKWRQTWLKVCRTNNDWSNQ